jgi:tRNA wybutosine-synthesizing protein 3
MTVRKEFLDSKEKAQKMLMKAVKDEKVDEEILPILKLINNFEEYYTSSSCAGRIVLLEIPNIGDKKNAKFLSKWHRRVKSNEINVAAKKAKKGQLWLLAQSPIIHVVANTNEMADKMVKTAISCGFKNSGVKSIGKKIVVEVCSTERLDAPIGIDGSLFCNKEYLQLLVKIANEVIERSDNKLSRFKIKLSNIYI